MFMLYPFQKDTEFNFLVYPKGEYICLGMKKNTYGSYWFNLKSIMKNYKVNIKDIKDLQSKDELLNFNYKKYLIINGNITNNSIDNIDKNEFRFTTISKKEAKARKIYTIKEINKLMPIELRKKTEIAGRLLNLEEPENNDKLIWVYIKKENGLYIG